MTITTNPITELQIPSIDRSDPGWLSFVLKNFGTTGCAVVTGVLNDAMIAETREHLYSVQEIIHGIVGHDRLAQADELGVLRLMLKYDPYFFTLLEIPEVLAFVDATVGDTAILHVQNGLVLPPSGLSTTFQHRFHMDFGRVLSGHLMSVNTFFALDEFTAESGGTLMVPGTHQADPAPSTEYLKEHGINATCPAGSMILFDSTLWHAAGENVSGKDRLALNMQFTKSFVKQQIDYVRGLGDEVVMAQLPRTQQLLGWYTRVVKSLDEYYRPTDERLYRSGQG